MYLHKSIFIEKSDKPELSMYKEAADCESWSFFAVKIGEYRVFFDDAQHCSDFALALHKLAHDVMYPKANQGEVSREEKRVILNGKEVA